jgi:hypothetical protein
VPGNLGVDPKFSAQNPVTLGVRVANAVFVFLERPLVVAVQRVDDLGDEIFLVRCGLLQIGSIFDVGLRRRRRRARVAHR